jgi:hypothetical protein
MKAPWEALLARLFEFAKQLAQVWFAMKAGEWKEQRDRANEVLDIKDEQEKIATEHPRDRDDLVRRLRERGF